MGKIRNVDTIVAVQLKIREIFRFQSVNWGGRGGGGIMRDLTEIMYSA